MLPDLPSRRKKSQLRLLPPRITGSQRWALLRFQHPKTLPENTDAPKVMAAAAGFESAFSDAAVIDPVGVIAAPENGAGPQHLHEDVAKRAYFYWIARGYSHGAADQDWLRAEAELTGKR